MDQYDVIIIGAGMAGLSAAYALAPSAKVLVLEQEEMPGYHSTGRSAALYASCYGSEKPVINALTKVSGKFFLNPPEGFCDHPLYSDRGVLFVAHESKISALEDYYQELKAFNPQLQLIGRQEVESRVPVLKPEYCAKAVYDQDVYELDVHALQEGYLKELRRCGGQLVTNFRVDRLDSQDDQWTVSSAESTYSAPVVVNAAGAWVDEIAALASVKPIGIQPLKRTVILVEPPVGVTPDQWPLVVEFEEQFYFKPDAGKILVSPANEDPSDPCDARPEELDIAYAAHYAEEATDLKIQRVDHSWAGLRNFVSDRSPVIGFDEEAPGFFWLAGQGGYGIQTAPAAGLLVASLILEDAVPEELVNYGLKKNQCSPKRLSEQNV